MKVIVCDLHARQQTLAMLDTTTGEVVKTTLTHEGEMCWSFTPTFVWESKRRAPLQWFVNLM